jgi:hypothetical protein
LRPVTGPSMNFVGESTRASAGLQFRSFGPPTVPQARLTVDVRGRTAGLARTYGVTGRSGRPSGYHRVPRCPFLSQDQVQGEPPPNPREESQAAHTRPTAGHDGLGALVRRRLQIACFYAGSSSPPDRRMEDDVGVTSAKIRASQSRVDANLRYYVRKAEVSRPEVTQRLKRDLCGQEHRGSTRLHPGTTDQGCRALAEREGCQVMEEF